MEAKHPGESDVDVRDEDVRPSRVTREEVEDAVRRSMRDAQQIEEELRKQFELPDSTATLRLQW